MASITKNTIFKPGVSSRDKAENTSAAARSIINAEVAARERKTARLKQMRMEADLAAPEAATAPAEKKTGKAKVRKAG